MATTNIPATSDTYVDDANVNTNYNTAVALSLSSTTPCHRILLKIPLSAFTQWDIITQARLNLNILTSSVSGDIIAVDTTQVWNPATVTWANQPTVGSTRGTAANGAVGPWFMDLTTYVAALVAASATELIIELRFSPESGTNTFTATSLEGGSGSPYLSVTYTPATVPGAPTSLSATGGLNKVNLSWSAPGSDGGAPITDYNVYRGTSPGGETLHDNVGSSTTSYEDITDIVAGTTYYYKVSAVNGIGEGDQSNEDFDAPFDHPSAPLTPAVSGHGNQSISLTWAEPASNGGSVVIDYKVYRGTSPGGEVYHAAVGSKTESYTDTTSLVNGTTYYYKILAVNAVGDGDLSSEVSEYPSTIPGAPTDLTSAVQDEHADLTWSAPASNGGSAITGYKLYIGGVLVHTIGTPTASFTDTGLTNGTSYSYTVKATNRDGDSSASAAFAYVPGAAPHAPTGVAIVQTRKTFYLYWTASDANGYAVSTYKVYRSTSTGTEVYLESTTNIYLTDDDASLDPAEEYYYKVSAVNAVGEGSLSSEVHESLLIPRHGAVSWFNETGYLEIRSGFDKNSQPSYGHTFPIDCRVSYKKHSVKGTNLETVMSKVQVWVDGSIACSPGDRVTLPSGEIRLVLSVERKVAADATVLMQVMFT